MVRIHLRGVVPVSLYGKTRSELREILAGNRAPSIEEDDDSNKEDRRVRMAISVTVSTAPKGQERFNSSAHYKFGWELREILPMVAVWPIIFWIVC